MSGLDEVCRPSFAARALGLGVLLASLGLGLWIALTGGAPFWTWLLLGSFVAVSGLASLANFGDRWHVSDEGLTYRNEITALIGFPRERRLPWSRVLRAADYEGKTWFLTVEGDKRWVLDHLGEHDRLGLILQQLEIPVSSVEKPRPWRRGDPGGGSPSERGPH